MDDKQATGLTVQLSSNRTSQATGLTMRFLSAQTANVSVNYLQFRAADPVAAKERLKPRIDVNCLEKKTACKLAAPIHYTQVRRSVGEAKLMP